MGPVKRIILGTMEIARQMNISESADFVRKFQHYGHTELDTAYMYAGNSGGGETGGKTEMVLGKMNFISGEDIATKANPGGGKTFSAKSIRHQLETSMNNLNVESVDMFYLHWPCMETPIAETLAAVNELYREGKFRRFGLSNFISWQVAEIQQICLYRGYIRPTVYQGMYNCLTRQVETELFPCLRRYDMSFNSYNPLAGGILTGKHKRDDNPQLDTKIGRFSAQNWGAAYRERYWRTTYFDALELIEDACKAENVEVSEAALRWIIHHSHMSGDHGDGLILGSGSVVHLERNLESVMRGPLSNAVLDAIESGYLMTKGHGPNYFRNVGQPHSTY